MSTNDFDTTHLPDKTKALADAIVGWLTLYCDAAPDGGGCRAFYSPSEWKARGETYGRDSALVLVHDGGDLAAFCNWSHGTYKALELFSEFVKSEGYYIEQCTGWYSAVYKLED
jgi:hypothetical protein